MEKKKLNLNELKVESFVTLLHASERHTIHGGVDTHVCTDDIHTFCPKDIHTSTPGSGVKKNPVKEAIKDWWYLVTQI